MLRELIVFVIDLLFLVGKQANQTSDNERKAMALSLGSFLG